MSFILIRFLGRSRTSPSCSLEMDMHTEDDVPPSAQKFIFSWSEERKIRRRYIWSAFCFDAVAIAFIIALCVGGWVHNSNQPGGIVNSGDVYLVTWSSTYRRNDSQRESTFAMSWFLSSCCFEEAYVRKDDALAGCIHRTPGSTFDLESIVMDMEARLAEKDNIEAQEGRFEGPTQVDFSGADTVGSTRDALASYGIYLAINIGTWMWQIIAKKHKVVMNSSHWRVMTAAQILSLFALLVASGVTTAAAYKANKILRQFEDVFNHHAVGASFAVMTWCAFISHLFGSLAYGASVLFWQRLQRPELYPPEPEVEEEIELIRTGNTRGAEQYRSRRPVEPDVHREVDPNAVDDELPPYSRVDPNQGRIVTQGDIRQPENLEVPSEFAHPRRAGNSDQAHEEAPAYELHDWPRDSRNARQGGET